MNTWPGKDRADFEGFGGSKGCRVAKLEAGRFAALEG